MKPFFVLNTPSPFSTKRACGTSQSFTVGGSMSFNQFGDNGLTPEDEGLGDQRVAGVNFVINSLAPQHKSEAPLDITELSSSVSSTVVSSTTASHKSPGPTTPQPSDRLSVLSIDSSRPSSAATTKPPALNPILYPFTGRGFDRFPTGGIHDDGSENDISMNEKKDRTVSGISSTRYISRWRSFDSLDMSATIDNPFVKETIRAKVQVDDVTQTKMINDYMVVRPLGKGSYGKVLLVRHVRTNQEYAMKIVRPRKKSFGQKGNDSIKREITVMKLLSHPHLVRLHEVIGHAERDTLYLVQQYVDRGCVAVPASQHAPERIVPIPERTLQGYARQLLKALKYLHRKGIAHRDIKPDNILHDSHGNAYLADFGVSAICTDDDSVCGVEGTLAFMAPELCSGESEVVSHLVDVWALGVSLYQLAYGTLPFFHPTPLLLAAAIKEQPLQFPDDKSPHTGPTLSAACKTMLAGMLQKDPRQRWGLRRALTCAWIQQDGCPAQYRPLAGTLPDEDGPSNHSYPPPSLPALVQPYAPATEERHTGDDSIGLPSLEETDLYSIVTSLDLKEAIVPYCSPSM
ncbi:calcium/calmodulin-dependent protein kinase kinase [Angomonas deanei]|nr:calcium/calmodulin-dependent protein kinase kinase [Angomonas deanei]|eukprot:EPY17929.1 calcium/calmodulin-dependent protein kinase kinase [Angomonas deanei]